MTPDDPSAVFMGVLLALGGVGLMFWMRRRGGLAAGSRAWPTARGRVLAAEVRSYRSGDGWSSRSHYPAVRYEYEVEGRRYTGDRIYFDQTSRAHAGPATRTVGRYPVGSEVTVYYDPTDPARALLEPGRSGACNYGVVGCGLLFVGLFFIVYLGYLKG